MVHNGFEGIKNVYAISDIQTVLEKYNLQVRGYFIFIGSLVRHKNVPQLIRVYKNYLDSNSIITKKLVIVGKEDNDFQNILSLIEELDLQQQVMVLNYVEENEKNILLQNAFALTFFSLYEGFGFPLLEAQTESIPVLLLDTSCLKEVAGQGCIVINNSSSEDEISDAFINAIKNLEQEKFRNQLIENGLQNLERFKWKNCAADTLKFYNS